MNDLTPVILWIEEQVKASDYRDVSVTLSIHAGKIAKITRAVTEKIGGKNAD